MKRNKKLIIMIIILILVIASAAFAYLYFMTDMFRSNQELFAKYFMQNQETLQKMSDLKTAKFYNGLENESKYESNTNIKMSYSEGGEISNPLNNLTAKLDVQKDNEQKYAYIDGQILYEDEEYLEAELIQEQEVYGIRFTDAIQQFITIENDENINEVMSDIGFNEEQTETVLELIAGEENSGIKTTELKDKYLNIIIAGISNGEFGKQKNAVITYNNNTVNTNAYSVLLGGEQVANILIEILNNLKNETELLQNTNNEQEIIEEINETIEALNNEIELPEVKITVYEHNKTTIRTVFEIGVYDISIENTEQNGVLKSKIKYTDSSAEQVAQIEAEISKTTSENGETVEIVANITEGTNSSKVTLTNTIQIAQGEVNVNTEAKYEENITTVSVIIENNTKIGQNFEKRETLGNENSRLINSLESQRRQELIDLVGDIVAEKTMERITLLSEKMYSPNSDNTENTDNENTNEMSQIEINRFNAKFEFYTGDEVSADSVKTLLDVVKDNMSSYENISSETPENAEETTNSSSTSETEKLNIKLNIEKDKVNEQGINEILEKINTNKRYKVSINYNESNGLIEYITITEN